MKRFYSIQLFFSCLLLMTNPLFAPDNSNSKNDSSVIWTIGTFLCGNLLAPWMSNTIAQVVNYYGKDYLKKFFDQNFDDIKHDNEAYISNLTTELGGNANNPTIVKVKKEAFRDPENFYLFNKAWDNQDETNIIIP